MIKKQGILSLVIIYIGFLIGSFNMLIIFPKILKPEQLGLFNILSSIAIIWAGLASLSVQNVIYKFNPYYKNYITNNKNDLLVWALITGIIGFLLVSLGVFFLKPLIIRKFIVNSKLLIEYFYLLYPFAFGFLIYSILEAYTIINFKSVIPNFIREIIYRVLISTGILLFVFKIISFYFLVNIYCLFYFILLFILIVYMIYIKRFDIHFYVSRVTHHFKIKMITFAVLNYLTTIIIIISTQIDTLIISSLLGLKYTAVFSIASQFSLIVQVPYRALTGITTSVISMAWQQKDLKKISSIFQKTALNLLLSSLFLVIIIFVNFDDILIFFKLPTIYFNGKYLVLLFGIAKIIDLGSGLNSEILGTSKYWKLSLMLQTIFVFLSFSISYVFIKKYGILGAGYASIIVMLIYNFIKFLVLYKFFKFQPFSIKTLYIIFIGILGFVALYFLPLTNNILANIFIRSSFFTMFYVALNLVLKTSEDFNNIMLFGWNKVKKIFTK